MSESTSRQPEGFCLDLHPSQRAARTAILLRAAHKLKEFLKSHGGSEFVARVRSSLSRRQWERCARRLIRQVPTGTFLCDVTTHYGDCSPDRSWQHVLEVFAADRIDFVIRTLGLDEIAHSTFADIGDSNGMFLRALGKDGSSINLSEEVLANIVGLKKIRGSLPSIELPDGSFDYVLLFETLEHLPDPIAGLREVARLTRKGAFVSIPHVKRSHVKEYWNNRKVPLSECHVFEFSPTDFSTIVTYTDLLIQSSRRSHVYARPRYPSELLYCALGWLVEPVDVRCGAFKAFDIYYLEKRRK